MHAWKDFVDQYQPAASFEDDIASTRVCQLAATAAELGTNAVGAVLLDDQGTVLAAGHNETFLNGFRSDLHGGMVSRMSSLPPKLQQISEELPKTWGLAECSTELREAASHIWDQTRTIVDRQIFEHARIKSK